MLVCKSHLMFIPQTYSCMLHLDINVFSFISRENTYVRAVGHLKSFKENSRSLIAFSLSPVLDFNEITHHMFDIIHSHLALSKVSTV